MNYIYDIYLNFNNQILDFFEWNKNDKIIHLKKIPIIKIDKNSFKDFCSNKFKINNNILNDIKYKTEIWKSKSNIKYCTLFCTNTSIMGIIFNNNGVSYKKSFLFIDEELEILDTLNNLKEIKIDYKILKKDSIKFKTRMQIKKDLFIKKNIYRISIDELKYVYYECFNKTNTKDKMILDINNIDKNSTQYEKLYNILKLISSIKK